MPILSEIDHRRGVTRSAVQGAITLADIRRHLDTQKEARALGYRELIDARPTAEPFLEPAEIWQVLGILRAARHQFGPRAIVVESDVVFGLARMFGTIVSGFVDVAVFRDAAAAERWLEASPPPAS